MPSGERHLKLEMILLPAFLGGYYYLDPTVNHLIAFGAAYLASSLLLTPDLDLRHNDTRKRWGLLGFIWIPYSKVFKHRGLSHNLFFGMLTRISYLSLLIGLGFAGAYYAGVNLPQVQQWQPNWPLIGAGVAGLYIPNILHALYDKWDTSRKMKRNRKLRARTGNVQTAR